MVITTVMITMPHGRYHHYDYYTPAPVTTTIAVTFISITVECPCYYHYYFRFYYCYYRNYYHHHHYHHCQCPGMANASIIINMRHQLLCLQKRVTRANSQVLLAFCLAILSCLVHFWGWCHLFATAQAWTKWLSLPWALWGSNSACFTNPCQWQMLLKSVPMALWSGQTTPQPWNIMF